jgi:hypothetical protein
MKRCVEWTGYKTPLGYGVVSLSRRQNHVYAHRLAYCRFHGIAVSQIKGIVIRHSCDNPSCVNPRHLSAGTQADNIADAVARGRNAKGSRHHHAKLTEEAVRKIRALHTGAPGECRRLGRMFNVRHNTISRIVNRRIWRHVN